MDYHNSSAGTVNLAVIKYTAVEPGKSKGSVFLNSGGVYVPDAENGRTDLYWESGPCPR
jgi:ADP-dependent phosphofructokinase/glucokinase